MVLDVGAHSGQFAKLFAKLAPDGTVFAFEPASYARSLLPLAKWGPWGGRIEIVPAALGDAQGTLQLNTPTKSAGSMRFGLAHLGAAANSATAGRAEAVLVTTVDRFTAERALDRLDFVKADIEGWEMRMLTGGAGTFARMRPAMLLELVDSHLARAGDSLDTAWTLLRGWGGMRHTAGREATPSHRSPSRATETRCGFQRNGPRGWNRRVRGRPVAREQPGN